MSDGDFRCAPGPLNDLMKDVCRRISGGVKPGLDVMRNLLECLGNPHQRLAVIHVAGTNGKGSVCALLESLFRHAGLKTGLYTSPHLVLVNERFKINQIDIDDFDNASFTVLRDGIPLDQYRATLKQPLVAR